MAEKTITIKVSEELHKKIKVKIAKDGILLKDYITNLINTDLNNNSNK
ncbi:MAG: hypothetical protein ACRDDY_16215 [Clostridium sp.]